MNAENRIAFLKSTSLFDQASDEVLEPVSNGMTMIDVPAGTTLFHEGDAGDAVYIIVKGTMSLEKEGIQLITRGPKEYIGEWSLIDDATRSTDAIAETDLHLLRWNRADFQKALSQNPAVAAGLLRILLDKLREDVDIQVSAEQKLRLANKRLERENHTLRLQLAPEPEVISHSPRMQEILNLAWRIADTSSTVILQGETGTGKEVLARAIHKRSPFVDGLFVPIHCAAFPEALLESELFGHEKGAFTGATTQRIGRFELANGGTLFLDEVGEIEPQIQTKLLRVLQEHQFERLGGNRTINVNARIIAATNRDLEAEVKAGRFREDLFYRLNVIPIVLPPLRERREDIPQFVEQFFNECSHTLGRPKPNVSPDTMELLKTYSWPGNVRELQNLIERMVVISNSNEIHPTDLPLEVRGENIQPEKTTHIRGYEKYSEVITLQEHERRYILEVLTQTNWVIAGSKGAARLLNVPPSTLRSRMKKLAITKR